MSEQVPSPPTIDALRVRAERARLRLVRAEHRLRTKEKSDALRRKIILGAWLLARIEGGARLPAVWSADLAAWLTRPADRALLSDVLPAAVPSPE